MPSNITLEDASAAYQCSKYGAGSCSVAISQGAIVGAAAGAAGGAAGGAVAGMTIGAGEGAIGGGFAGGAAGSATSYIGNGLFTGDMSFGEGFRQTMIGGFSGAVGSEVSYGVGEFLPKNPWNPLISESVGGFASGFSGSYLNGNSSFSEALVSGLQSAGISAVSYGLFYGFGRFFGGDVMGADGAYYDPNDEVMQKRARWLKEYNPDEYSMLSHYFFDNESFGYDPYGLVNSMSAYDMGVNLRSGGFNYQNEEILRFYSCDFGREGVGSDGRFRYSGARKLSTQLPSKIIVGPTRPLYVFPVNNKYGRLIYVGNYVMDGGSWAVYKAGRYLGAVNQAIY